MLIKKNSIKIIVSLLISTSILLLIVNRNYRHKVEIKAKIVKIDHVHIGMGYYHKRIYYTYEFSDTTYTSKFTIGKKIGVIDEKYTIVLRVDTMRHDKIKYVGKIDPRLKSSNTNAREFKASELNE